MSDDTTPNITPNMPKPTVQGASRQDRLMSKMSLDEIRKFRQDAMKKAMSAGLVSRSHNKAQNELAAAIHAGERLTGKKLQQLIKQTKAQTGVSAGELIAFTLGKTKLNLRIQKDAGKQTPSMSPELLRYYVANVKLAADKFAGGITPSQVIQNSTSIDIRRANEQIFMASVFKKKGDVLYFLTNAGPDSDAMNHKVVVQLLDYQSFLLGRTSLPRRDEIVNMLKNGKVKFDCDCGRHQYWYRYLATIGRYNYGIHENRYPSTRNPALTGVACKHTLRVMQMMMSGYGVSKLQGYIKADLAHLKGRGAIDGQSKRTELTQLKQEAKYQSAHKTAEHWRRVIKKQLKQAAAQVKKPSPNAVQVLKNAGITLSAEQQKVLESWGV